MLRSRVSPEDATELRSTKRCLIAYLVKVLNVRLINSLIFQTHYNKILIYKKFKFLIALYFYINVFWNRNLILRST